MYSVETSKRWPQESRFLNSHTLVPDSTAVKESPCNARDLGSVPGLGRSPGEGKGYSLQYSGLENSRDSIVYGVAKSRTRLSDFHSLTHTSVSLSVVSDSLQPHGLQPTRLLYPWNFPGMNTRVGCHFLPQGIFLIQESNPGLLHCRQILYQLSYEGSPYFLLKFESYCLTG